MSKQGWQGFLAADGVDDWVVLHGGAAAVFRVRTMGDAARLAEAVAGVPGIEGSEAPESWVLSDRAGNRVCVTAWPDGAVPAS